MIGFGLRWIAIAVVVVLSSACQNLALRDGGPGSDATGQLGSPASQQSPADIYIDLSGAYLREGQLTNALLNANKAVMADSGSSNAHYMLALVRQRLGELGPAEEAFRKSVALDPHNPLALNAYGSFLCELKRYEEADEYFRRALGNPLYATPWIASQNAGWCNEMAGDMKAAEIDYRAALRTNPRFAPSLLAMAKISYTQGNFLSARAYLQRYAEVTPHNAESLWLGVLTEKQLGDQDQMATYSLKLRANFPDSEEAMYLKTVE
ncbi:MAG: type IV pilus biogenesis/stability protein PilW [Sedimenticolaceae bacterium]